MLMWKIMGASDISVIYIYIYIYRLPNLVIVLPDRSIKKKIGKTHIDRASHRIKGTYQHTL